MRRSSATSPTGWRCSAVYDVLVAGAGPAGSALAWTLARAGLKTALLEARRHPRGKPCGESLNPGAAAALERLAGKQRFAEGGAAGPAQTFGHPLRGWLLHCGTASMEAEFPGGAAGFSCRRDQLDGWLLEQAELAGAEVLQEHRVRRAMRGDDGGCLVEGEAGGGTFRIRARYVAGADGIRSAVARSSGLGAPWGALRKIAITARMSGIEQLRDRVELHLNEGSTLGIAPLKGDAANVTLVLPAGSAWAEEGRNKSAAMLRELSRRPRLEGRCRHAVLEDEPLACGPFHQPIPQPASGRIVLVGDAAGYYDPLTGQGIYRALRSAELAAPLLLRALETGDERQLSVYGRLYRKEFAAAAALQRVIEFGAARPRLFEASIRILGRTPGAGSRLAAWIGDCGSVT
ncbi:Monooxygenase FAD-binding [Paenibacillus sp. P22]|nr:Monooxygenase FAD-binding [Paenibacillus sp. P22]